ncbi:MAG: SCO family protein [Actinobacteria bacterium]|nr:SCO family protein [Actinomycetota bacterium]
MDTSAAGSIRLAVATLAAGLALLTVAACGGNEKNSGAGEPARLIGAEPPVVKTVGKLRMPALASDGKVRTASFVPPRDGLTVVFFGYTFCPDVCPTSLAEMRLAINALPATDRSRVTVAFVTVDPKRDTFPKLREYLGHFFEHNPWLTVRTADRRKLIQAERAFGASHTLGKPNARGDYDVSHTTRTYAVGDDGNVTLEWLFGTPGVDIAGDLKILLDPSETRSIRTNP